MDNDLKISIVTPSYNQGSFLEKTICSILGQNYDKLEYIIIDGGSTDNSVEIINKYRDDLAYSISEPDGGQYDAINKGFARSSGEIMGWLNADDLYAPWTFKIISEIFKQLPEVQWITSRFPLGWNFNNSGMTCHVAEGFNAQAFYSGRNLPGMNKSSRNWIQQESTFWRRSIWNMAGGSLDNSLKLAADFELWARFFQFSELYTVSAPLGGFRTHPEQKTSRHLESYSEEAQKVLKKYNSKRYSIIRPLLIKILRRITPSRFAPVPYPSWPCSFIFYSLYNRAWEIRRGLFS